jgi:hypothetical protein
MDDDGHELQLQEVIDASVVLLKRIGSLYKEYGTRPSAREGEAHSVDKVVLFDIASYLYTIVSKASNSDGRIIDLEEEDIKDAPILAEYLIAI